MRPLFIVALLNMTFFTSCKNDNGSIKIEVEDSTKIVTPITGIPEVKPIINVYVENSLSMNGFFRGNTDFKQTVYNYLSDIRISNITDSFNLYYINSRIIPYGSSVSDFIEKLNPNNFTLRGGDRGTSDISNVIDSVISEIRAYEIAILVTDGIFSPGSDKDANEYLVNQKIGIKNNIADYLNENSNAGVIVYQLSSNFNGNFSNKDNAATWINAPLLYYVWIISDLNHLNSLIKEIPKNKFQGGGVLNNFAIISGRRNVEYAILPGSGRFKLSKDSPKNTITKWKRDKRGNPKKARFSVNVKLDGLLLDEQYITDLSNYEISNKDLELTIEKAPPSQSGYTHKINIASDLPIKGQLSIKLKSKIPAWVDEYNDDEGINYIENKTYGIKYQIEGVYEAFTFSDKYLTEIIINIK